MLGIFGVNMPPMYGEGSKAFVRLQLEIIKISDDESIFAWQSDPKDTAKYPERGMLACRNGSGQAHFTAKMPVRKEGGRSA